MPLSKEYIAKTRSKAAAWYEQAELSASSLKELDALVLPQKHDEAWRYFQPHRFIESMLADPTRPIEKTRLKDKADCIVVDQVVDTSSSKNCSQVDYQPSANVVRDYWTALAKAAGATPVSVSLGHGATQAKQEPSTIRLARLTGSSQILQLVAEKNSSQTVVLEVDGLRSGLTQVEFVVKENAQIRLVIQPSAYAGVSDFLRVHAEVGRDASLEVFYEGQSVSQPSLGRVEWFVDLAAAGATAKINCLEQVGGERGKSHYLQLRHHAKNTSSEQNVRFVLDDQAKASFHGGVKIDQGAKEASAHQLNNNLLLADGAQMYTRPELQIEEDEVKCSHGATVSDLDSGADFYLRSRGLSPEQTRKLMVHAFAKAVVPSWAKGLANV